MKKLLVHSDNTSFNKDIFFPVSESFRFDLDFDKDIDLYITESLDEEHDVGLKKKIERSDIVFIKAALSQNYLEYLGLRLAYHIRMSKGLGEKAKIPIIIICEESFQYLGLIYPEPSILFTNGLYLMKESLEDYYNVLNMFSEGRIQKLYDLSSFYKSITINPPANYQNHHNVANEWALARYFTMLEKDESNFFYSSFRKKLFDLEYLKTLHFKHLEAKANRQIFNSRKHTGNFLIKNIDGLNFGLIDDEAYKGWFEFYSYIFDKSKASIVPYINFQKDKSKEQLIFEITNWVFDVINSSQPIDIFIIDLRLHDDDFIEQEFESLTGIQIIKFIKKQNPGIQIIVSTASNKVWNYQNCLEQGVKYFTIKESPETFNNRNQTRTTFLHFTKQVSEAANNIFLAELFRNIYNLKRVNIFSNRVDGKEFADLTFGKNGFLDQIFNLLSLSSSNELIINQCLLISFQVLENYCDLPFVGVFDFKNSSGKVCSIDKEILIDIFTQSSDNKNILTKLELVRGRIEFQNENEAETIKSFNAFEKSELKTTFSSGIDATSLVKIISVLHFRHSVPKVDIEKIIALRYFRSNVAAHYTGRVKADNKINSTDVLFFFKIFLKIFSYAPPPHTSISPLPQ